MILLTNSSTNLLSLDHHMEQAGINMSVNQGSVDVEEVRYSDRIRAAVRARKFTSAETLAMGFSLIDFSLKFRKAAEDAFNE